MMNYLNKRRKSDKADSSIVSMIILFPIVFAVMITLIDVSIYFSNRSIIQSVARDGARTIAILGGNGNATQATPLEVQYGLDRDASCAEAANGWTDAVTSTSSAVECNILSTLNMNKGLVAVDVTSVHCTPEITSSIGQRTTCTIEWSYNSVPGSALSLVREEPSYSAPPALSNNTTTGTSESEVNMTGISLVSR